MKTFLSRVPRERHLAVITLGALLTLVLAWVVVWHTSTPSAATPTPTSKSAPDQRTPEKPAPDQRTPEKPDLPANLVRVDEQGAAAAAQYAFALSLWGLASGDHVTLDALCSGEKNSWCADATQRAEDVAARRATFTGCAGSTQVLTTIPVTAIARGERSFGVELEFSQDDCTRKAGSDLTFWPGGDPSTVDVEVSHAGDGWHVDDVWLPQ